jgi:hypothetical protein
MESTVPKEEDSLIDELIDKKKEKHLWNTYNEFHGKSGAINRQIHFRKINIILNQYLNKFKYMEAQISKKK